MNRPGQAELGDIRAALAERGVPARYAHLLLDELADHVACRTAALEASGVDEARARAVAELGAPEWLAEAATGSSRHWAYRAPGPLLAMAAFVVYTIVAVVSVPLLVEWGVGLARVESSARLTDAIHAAAVLGAALAIWLLARCARRYAALAPTTFWAALLIAVASGFLHATAAGDPALNALRIVYEPHAGAWRGLAVLAMCLWMFRASFGGPAWAGGTRPTGATAISRGGRGA